jgi:hypothetical protein
MRASAALMTRLLPRRAAIALIAGAARDLSSPTQPATQASTQPQPGA